MKSIEEYINLHISNEPYKTKCIVENYSIIEEYFNGDIPEKILNRIYNYENPYILLTEYLNTVSTEKTIHKIQQELSNYINTIYTKNNLIYVEFKYYDDTINKQLHKIINVYNYIIHTKISNRIILEPKYSKNYIDYIYDSCNGIMFHITTEDNCNNILKNGLRPKTSKHETKETIKSKQHSLSDYNGKIYLIAIDGLKNVKQKLSEIKHKVFGNRIDLVVLKVYIPHEFSVYKDETMFDEISYFTYLPINKKYIEKTNY